MSSLATQMVHVDNDIIALIQTKEKLLRNEDMITMQDYKVAVHSLRKTLTVLEISLEKETKGKL